MSESEGVSAFRVRAARQMFLDGTLAAYCENVLMAKMVAGPWSLEHLDRWNDGLEARAAARAKAAKAAKREAEAAVAEALDGLVAA